MFIPKKLQGDFGNGMNILAQKYGEASFDSFANITGAVLVGVALVTGSSNIVSDITNNVKSRIVATKEALAQKGISKEELKNFNYNPLNSVFGDNEKTLGNLQAIKMFGPFSRKEDSVRISKYNPRYTPAQVSQAVSHLWR